MSDNTILSTKDFTILEVMRDRLLGGADPLAPLLKRKIESALVMFRDDVPPDVATLNSRVTFTINGRGPDTRIITHDRIAAPVGMFLPITTPRGLALLGLAEGQVFTLMSGDGTAEVITLEKVDYQPEAARREKETQDRLSIGRGRPVLKLVRGDLSDRPRLATAGAEGPEDPGPTAA